ncbi:phage regulatory protein/antirepressor Ant [Falcatimonas sp. MSJ-15]|uniref:Rha family transcriptional regulator n=1 Tax=Falcatimonas sp. MSJ-15 TaxID=2841515 RepID=UPI001C12641A|nr:phage regulatory protein/antirepressor Ant [Falcatimonas sp. MSJ-15]MBU5469171.1 phage regulatory protein/antirepressor Ant [Falcatimonas sp. MSJ-15]
MREITLRNENGQVATITSLEVAEMVGKEHNKLLRDIREYCNQLSLSKIGQSDFFEESTYKTERGKEYPCYRVTKKGCEFIAHKLTGVKGTEFTALYINKFHTMEEQLNEYRLPTTYKEALLQLVEQVEENERLLADNEQMKPKADYHDAVLNKEGLITTTVIAKDLGLTSAVKLNNILHRNRIIFKDKSGTWYPYAEYEWLIECGYADYQSYDSEYATPSLKWTEKGRKWIIENLCKWS